MKAKYLILLVFPALVFLSCSSALDNSVTIKNTASEAVQVNIFGKVLTIKTGATQIIKDISKGSYKYETTYSIPANVSSSQVEGSATGTLEITAGTNIQMFFASRIQKTTGGGSSSAQDTYVLVVSVSSSDAIPSGTTTP